MSQGVATRVRSAAAAKVHVERRVAVPLQERRGHLDVDLAFDRAADDARLVLASGQDRDLARIHDGGDAHGDRLARHVLLAEEVGGRVASRDRVERHEARPALEAGARLIEADVARLADAQDLEVDTARILDRLLVLLAILVHALPGHRPVRDVDVGRVDVHVGEQVLPHESMVGVDAVRGHRVVLVEVERDDVLEAQPLLFVLPDELAVDADRRGARREAQHCVSSRSRCAP